MSDLRLELREFRVELRDFRTKLRAARAATSAGGTKVTKEERATLLPELMEVIIEGVQVLGAGKDVVKEISEYMQKKLSE